MNNKQEALQKHKEWQGKIEVISRVSLENSHDLSVAYTPGVAVAAKKSGIAKL